MQIAIPMDGKKFTLAVTVKTTSPQNIRFCLKDAIQTNTTLINRWLPINGTHTTYIQVPLCGENGGTLVVFNDDIGNIPAQSDSTFQVVKVNKLPLEIRTDLINLNDKNIQSWIDFSQRFAYNAGVLPSGKYQSDDGQYTIELLPTITDDYGNILNTSSRVAKDNGVIQASQAKFDPMSVPMRIAILDHEWAHFYRNKDINNEKEADKNGLNLYLSLGFPRIEADDAYSEAFDGANYDDNWERYVDLHNYIEKFAIVNITATN